MADVKIQTLKSGPLHIEGPVTLVDSDGKAYQVQETIHLCRCGGSSNKPFCDGTHRREGFTAEEVAP